MRIAHDKMVTVNYTLTDDKGEVLDSSQEKEPLRYVQGSGSLIKGFEHAMEGKSVNESFSFTLKPEDGYGEHRTDLVFEVPRERFRDVPQLDVGMPLHVQTTQGPMVVRVSSLQGEKVTLDANHPLAGKNLTFKVSVVDVRDATKEELENAHRHSDGCGSSCGDTCGSACSEGCCS